MYSVYALVDPRDGLPFSLGITEDVYKRFAQYLQCNSTNLVKNERIQELKQAIATHFSAGCWWCEKCDLARTQMEFGEAKNYL